MHVIAASSVELEEVIKSLKNASAGWDGIKACALKSITEYIAQPLSALFNRSAEEGVVPSKLKITRVTPIF